LRGQPRNLLGKSSLRHRWSNVFSGPVTNGLAAQRIAKICLAQRAREVPHGILTARLIQGRFKFDALRLKGFFAPVSIQAQTSPQHLRSGALSRDGQDLFNGVLSVMLIYHDTTLHARHLMYVGTPSRIAHAALASSGRRQKGAEVPDAREAIRLAREQAQVLL